jgi:hypothetical protein
LTGSPYGPPALEDWTRASAEEFLNKSGQGFPRGMRFVFYPTPEDLPRGLKKSGDLPGYPERVGRDLVFHLVEEALRGWPLPAVKGWIQRQAAEGRLKLELGPAPFNFHRQILPLFPVSGSAVAVIRQIVDQLKEALEAFMTTRILLDLGLVEAQCHFFAFRLKAPAGDPVLYREALPHGWVRASILSGRLPDFLALSLLAGRGPAAGAALKRRWWQAHDFFIREDQALLEELALTVMGPDPEPFPELLAGMFIRMREALLGRRPSPAFSPTLH